MFGLLTFIGYTLFCFYSGVFLKDMYRQKHDSPTTRDTALAELRVERDRWKHIAKMFYDNRLENNQAQNLYVSRIYEGTSEDYARTYANGIKNNF